MWKLTRVEVDLRETMVAHHEETRKQSLEASEETRKQISEHELRSLSAVELLRREVGETAAALRQKITDVEIWGRDHFVRRDDFKVVLMELKETNLQLGADLKNWLGRLEARIYRRPPRLAVPASAEAGEDDNGAPPAG